MPPLPPVDPLQNLAKLLQYITQHILSIFPILVGALTLILFLVIAFLLFLFQGSTFITP